MDLQWLDLKTGCQDSGLSKTRQGCISYHIAKLHLSSSLTGYWYDTAKEIGFNVFVFIKTDLNMLQSEDISLWEREMIKKKQYLQISYHF